MAKALEESLRRCKNCDKMTKHRRNINKHGLIAILIHIFLAVVTHGWWLVAMLIWGILTIQIGGWVCSECDLPKKGSMSLIRVSLVVIVLAIFLVVFLGRSTPSTTQNPAQKTVQKTTPKSKKSIKTAPTNTKIKYIKGVKPSSIYLSLEKKGFKNQGPTSMGADLPILWVWNLKSQSGDVEVWFRDGVINVYKIRFNFLSQAKAIEAFNAAIPYAGIKHEKQAKEWIRKNHNKPSATVIDGIPFKIMKPGRMTIIQIGFSVDT